MEKGTNKDYDVTKDESISVSRNVTIERKDLPDELAINYSKILEYSEADFKNICEYLSWESWVLYYENRKFWKVINGEGEGSRLFICSGTSYLGEWKGKYADWYSSDFLAVEDSDLMVRKSIVLLIRTYEVERNNYRSNSLNSLYNKMLDIEEGLRGRI